MPSRQGTRGQGRRAVFVRNAKGKKEKVARKPPSVVRLLALPFSGETTMSILFPFYGNSIFWLSSSLREGGDAVFLFLLFTSLLFILFASEESE